MARSGRNGPCPCRSGRKAKRCCGVRTGPAPEQLAAVELRERAAVAREHLEHWCDDCATEARELLILLPERHLELHVALPPLSGPALRDLEAVLERGHDPDLEPLAAALRAAVQELDTAVLRLRLAIALDELAGRGLVERWLADAGLVSLRGRLPALLAASVANAARVRLGLAPTPSGLVVHRRARPPQLLPLTG